MDGNIGNLPPWPGASKVYSKAYLILKNMAHRGHAIPANQYTNGKRWVQISAGTVSSEMTRLIDALNKGNEETIKGLLLMTWVYY